MKKSEVGVQLIRNQENRAQDVKNRVRVVQNRSEPARTGPREMKAGLNRSKPNLTHDPTQIMFADPMHSVLEFLFDPSSF